MAGVGRSRTGPKRAERRISGRALVLGEVVVGKEARRAGLGGLWELACRPYCRTGGIVDRGEAILLHLALLHLHGGVGDVPSTAVAGVSVVSVTRHGDLLANFARLPLCHRP